MTGAVDDHARLEEVMNVILAIAANDFSARASVGDGEALIDGIAQGLNMLAEEVGRQRRAEARYRERMLHSERLAAVGMLAAGVAHEINNPSATVLATLCSLEELIKAFGAELAREGQLTPERAQRAREMAELVEGGKASVVRIATIVKGMKQFSSGPRDVVVPVRLDTIASQCCSLVAREILGRARLETRLDPVPEVLGEPTKLTQLVSNLLLNAAQAIAEGASERNVVEVSTTTRGDHVVLSVRDTGCGVSPELHDRIFEPFFTTKSVGGGTGLGLALSAEIARYHSGELRLRHSDARGSTFELCLPFDTRLSASGATPAPRPARRRLRVLLVDDDEHLLHAVARMLGRKHDVQVALGGAAAIARLEVERTWDVIVCDIIMPGVDGVQVYEWAVRSAPELEPRFLFCSGGACTVEHVAFAAAHRDRLLDKPVPPAEFDRALSRFDEPNAP
ncbi:MAG: ATP-binding protein [Polyangiaceae bacterium]